MPFELNTQGACCDAPISPQPSIFYDFAGSRSLAPVMGLEKIDFSRASSASYTGKDGLIHYAAKDEPRFEHDPITGACLGLLVEGPASNVQPYSEDITADGAIGMLRTTNVGRAPDGRMTADLWTESTANSEHLASVVVSGVAIGQQYCYSVFIKPDFEFSDRSIAIRLLGGGGLDSSFVFGSSYFSQNQHTELASPRIAAGSKVYPDGWVRLYLSVETPGDTDLNFRVQLRDSGGGSVYAGDGQNGFYYWGKQVEVDASMPTSYVPTDASAATRAEDVVNIGDTTGWQDGDAVSVYAACVPLTRNDETRGGFDRVFDGPGFYVRRQENGKINYSGPSGYAEINSVSTIFEPCYIALARGGAEINLYVDGTGDIGNSEDDPVGTGSYKLGRGGGSHYFNGLFIGFAAWAAKLENAELDALTEA